MARNAARLEGDTKTQESSFMIFAAQNLLYEKNLCKGNPLVMTPDSRNGLVVDKKGNGKLSKDRQKPPQKNLTRGKSLSHTNVCQLMNETKFRVVGVIEITNSTNYKLTDPKIHPNGGRVSVKPKDVEPFTQEAVVVHKYPLTATGSYGTLSFYIQQLRCRVILMWSLPFNRVSYTNWLGLYITGCLDVDHTKLFGNMYYEGLGKIQKYGKLYGATHFPSTKSTRKIKLIASMTDTRLAHINFKVQEI